MGIASGVGVVVLILGLRVLVGIIATLAGAARQLVMERGRRLTLLAVAQAVPEGGTLMDERPDGSKLTIHAGKATSGRLPTGELR